MIIRRIGVLSLGVFQCGCGVVFGVIGGLLTFVPGPGLGDAAIGSGITALVFMPIAYAIVGFVSGVVSALIYNLVSRIVGGIEIEITT